LKNTGEFVARHALIIYQYDKGYEDDESLRPLEHYITQHRISKTGELREGKPLTRETLSNICSIIFPSILSVEYLSQQVIAYSPDYALLWWLPAGVRTLFFGRATGIKSGRYPTPPTLMLVVNRKLYTWALATNERPTPDTTIFHSPFYNIHPEGSCCMGNIPLPGSFTPQNIADWEETFFNGCLSSELPPKLNGCAPDKLWKSLYGKKKFPAKYLVPHAQNTVSNIIDGLKRRHGR